VKILLVPLDDRPVTYLLPQMVANVAGVQAIVPPRELFGSLNRAAQADALQQWIDNACTTHRFEAVFVCADTLIYGGLINSRRGTETYKELEERVRAMTNWRKKVGNIPIYLQASIMRISDNHDNTEEKEYWSRYGREIFAWSENLHRLHVQGEVAPGLLRESELRVPEAIRQDYLKSRYRNFKINLDLLDALYKGSFSRIVFSLDDSGENGLNVLEQEKLEKRILQLNIGNQAVTYAGADEVLCTMIAHWLATQNREHRTCASVSYALPAAEFCPSRYEGQSIGNSIRAQLKAAGIKQLDVDASDKADFAVIVHAGENGQGDHIILPGHQDVRSVDTREALTSTINLIRNSTIPCVLCDVAYANGGDPMLVAELLKQPQLLKKLWAYSGWNTTGNAVGAALAIGVARLYSENPERADALVKETLFIRLADDWAYQTQARKNLKAASAAELTEYMRPLVQEIAQALEHDAEALRLSFPWQRLFEVEVTIPRSQALAGAKAD
jgi:Protein of unknown function (DUF4127)